MSEEIRFAALARLAASRDRLRRTLLPNEDARQDEATAGAAGGFAPRRWRALWRLWMRRSPLAPVLGAIGSGAGAWWRRHPWHDTVTVASEVGRAGFVPLIRRHPWVAIGLGATAGGLLVAAKPWQWRSLRVYAKRSARLSTAWAAGQLAQPAVQWVMAALAASQLPPRRQPSQEPAAVTAGD